MEAKEPYELFDDLGNLVEEKGFETDWNYDVLYVIVPYKDTDGKKASAEIRVCLLNDDDVCITYLDYLKRAKQSYLEDVLYDGVSTLKEFVEYIDDLCFCEEKDMTLYDEEDLPVIVKELSSLVSKMKKDLEEVSIIFSDALKNHSERRMIRLHKRRFEAQEDTRMVGEVVETLIRIKDTFYGDLTLAQRDALDDACNLLANNIGERTRYDYTCRVDDGARRF